MGGGGHGVGERGVCELCEGVVAGAEVGGRGGASAVGGWLGLCACVRVCVRACLLFGVCVVQWTELSALAGPWFWGGWVCGLVACVAVPGTATWCSLAVGAVCRWALGRM